ncbi:asparagine synthetase B family protein [Aspergillus lucknowensis]|uniref:Nucleophile aminohydrolase n=1 Tax=Aspergillus lucknowensis TaxID=176173 RepID=A0ABR4LI06_9EURO
MCGITAFLAVGQPPQTRSREQIEQEIHNSLDIVKHRGPDASGKWINSGNRVGLGHVRLSIVDLSPEGNQPFEDTENEVYAVVNGELYDHERYREELAAEYNFRGHSDCEIVLALYKHYGLDFLSHLRGEFALVLWDAKREVFVATRDRYGIKSLYYTVVGDRLLVATEMKQFLAYGWEPEWDVRSVYESGWVFDERTIFRDVKKIQPGHYLISRNYGEFRTDKYWDMHYPDKFTKEVRTEEEMIEGVRQRLLDAVRVRLRADVPVGIYLSGGIDSSAIAGMVVHLVKEGAKLGDSSSKDLSRIQCFTVQFDKGSGFDESDVAERTAEFLGVKFNPVHVPEGKLAERFENAVWYSEAFMADINGAGKLAMAEVAHNAGFKVVITGEGSDEHFAGYSYFQNESLLEDDLTWTPPDYDPTKREEAIRNAGTNHIQGVKWVVPQTLPSTMRTLNNTRVAGLLTRAVPLYYAPWLQDEFGASDGQTVLTESFDGEVRHAMAQSWHPLHTAEYLWTKTAFPNSLLRYLGDNIDMAYQVESRPAFLDHNLTEFANSLPPSLKMKYNYGSGTFTEKYILREAVRPFVTEEIYKRKKQPYMAPMRYAVDGPVHRKLKELITKENIEALGFVDWERTEPLVEKGIVGGDPLAFRAAIAAAQCVVVSQRFGVKKATQNDCK